MSSIYKDCADAARMLLADSSLRIDTTEEEGIFTELDVIALAARNSGRDGRVYDEDHYRAAQREASQVMGMLWRGNKAVRFGPVRLPGHEDPDYARLASKIIFASPDGPEAIETPNGTFPRMFVHEDVIPPRRGRRLGSERSDFEPWEGQLSLPGSDAPEPGIRRSSADQENIRLKAENAALRSQLSDAMVENRRLRAEALAVREQVESDIRELVQKTVAREFEMRAA